MKYKIRIDGGFTGFPRDYDGEVELEGPKAIALLSALEASPEAGGGNWPDALHYTIEVQHGTVSRKAAFSEPDIPAAIREFLQLIGDTNRKGSNRQDN